MIEFKCYQKKNFWHEQIGLRLVVIDGCCTRFLRFLYSSNKRRIKGTCSFYSRAAFVNILLSSAAFIRGRRLIE